MYIEHKLSNCLREREREWEIEKEKKKERDRERSSIDKFWKLKLTTRYPVHDKDTILSRVKYSTSVSESGLTKKREWSGSRVRQRCASQAIAGRWSCAHCRMQRKRETRRKWYSQDWQRAAAKRLLEDTSRTGAHMEREWEWDRRTRTRQVEVVSAPATRQRGRGRARASPLRPTRTTPVRSSCKHRRTVHRGLGARPPPQFFFENLQTGPLSFF